MPKTLRSACLLAVGSDCPRAADEIVRSEIPTIDLLIFFINTGPVVLALEEVDAGKLL